MSRVTAVNEFTIKFANVNGSGSASANQLFAKSVFRLGLPVAPKNIVRKLEMPPTSSGQSRRPRGGRASVGRSLDGGDIASHDGRHIARADLLPTDQRDLGGLDHGVGRFDHRDQTLRLDHPECFAHSVTPSGS